MSRHLGRMAAPDFPEGLEWLNTDRPLALGGLRGKVVLLNFWARCDELAGAADSLRKVQAEHPDELVVISIHSGPPGTEENSDQVRRAVQDSKINHLVIDDRAGAASRRYGVRDWPAIVLIDPNGKIVSTAGGKAAMESLKGEIAEIIEDFDGRGMMDRRPLKLKLAALASLSRSA